MRVLFLGSDRKGPLKALQYLTEHMEVIGCVGRNESYVNRVEKFCIEKGIPCYTNKELYEKIELGEFRETDVDVVISYLFSYIIREPLLDFKETMAINFHPAPLPEHKGVAGCCFDILEDRKYCGVSCHFIDVGLDTGDIIKVNRFSLDSDQYTGKSLESFLQTKMLELFYEIMELLEAGKEIPRIKQIEEGYYYSKKTLNEKKRILEEDTIEVISRKVDALWFPPYAGATINIKGKDFTLVDDKILNEVSELYKIVEEYDIFRKK